MENGEGPSHTPASSAPSSTPVPVYSREVTLQAHFTFGTQSMAPVQYAHVTPTSSSALTARPIMASGAPVEQFHWGPDGGAQCSITCGREGLTMTYNAQPTAAAPRHTPCAICDTIAAARPGPAITSGDSAPPAAITTSGPLGVATTAVTTLATPAISRSLMDLNRPHEAAAAARSLTFSGSLDRATQRPVQQRPYGRRCKSTAHIILQNNELGPRDSRPHEFHSTQREDPHHHHHHHLLQGATHEGRGRARTRGGADSHFTTTSGGWERVHSDDRETRGRYYDARPALPPPCCPCQQCNALYSLASTLAHDRTCHACLHHHHHHHHHHPHPPCSPPPIHTQGPPEYPHPVGPEEPHAPPGKCPTTCTFNSHRSYEGEQRRDWCGHQGYIAPSAAPQPRSRTPSPRHGRRGSPKRSPRRSSAPSPESRTGRTDDPPQQPQTTPVLPRRFPRMGAAAAAAAAASGGTTAGQVHTNASC